MTDPSSKTCISSASRANAYSWTPARSGGCVRAVLQKQSSLWAWARSQSYGQITRSTNGWKPERHCSCTSAERLSAALHSCTTSPYIRASNDHSYCIGFTSYGTHLVVLPPLRIQRHHLF